MVNSYEDIMGTPMAVEDHPAYNKPDATEHYAGEVLPFPIDQKTSEVRRINSMKNIDSPHMIPGTAKSSATMLKGPGAN